MLLATENEITTETVRSGMLSASATAVSQAAASGTLAERVQTFERESILAELKRSNYHITNAARSLGLERSHLYKKAEQLGIDIRKERREEESDAS